MPQTLSDGPSKAPLRQSQHSTRLRIGLTFSILALVLFFLVGALSGGFARRELQQSAFAPPVAAAEEAVAA